MSKVNTVRSLKSDMKKVDAHVVDASEYDDLPELTDEMLARAVIKKAGRPVLESPRELISLRVPVKSLENGAPRALAGKPAWCSGFRVAHSLQRLKRETVDVAETVNFPKRRFVCVVSVTKNAGK